MNKLFAGVRQFVLEEDGVTAIEYGLIAALIAVVIIASVQLVGDNLNVVFNFISGKLNSALVAGGA